MSMIRQKRKKTPAKAGNFTLAIDPKGLTLVGFLLLCSWGALFYVGFYLGQAKRSPENFQQVVKQIEPKERAVAKEDSFAVFKLKDNPAGNLEQTPDEIAQKPAQQGNPPPQPSNPAPAGTPPKPPAAAVRQNPATEKLYTIQIVAISDYNRANNYVKLLRERNFDAYLQTITDDRNSIIYRVRVGQSPYETAQATLLKLGAILEGIEPTILEIK